MALFQARLCSSMLGMATLIAPLVALGESVPDALSVEWQGKKPCEKLYEDSQIRVARCTFPPPALSTTSKLRKNTRNSSSAQEVRLSFMPRL